MPVLSFSHAFEVEVVGGGSDMPYIPVSGDRFVESASLYSSIARLMIWDLTLNVEQ